MGAFLPALAFGGKLLLGGATVGGTALGAASLYDGITGAGKGFRDQAYAAGPDPETGKFSAGLIGNQFIKEDSPEFAKGFKNYALNKSKELRTMQGVLGDKFQFDATKTIPQNIALNRNNFDRESVVKQGELARLTPEYIERKEDRDFTKQQYLDSRLDAQQGRLDLLNMQQLQMQREDQRYNERLDREERNRRQEAVMAMMGGLTSLGAAFAL